MSLTLPVAQKQLDEYLKAESSVLLGQEHQLGDSRLKMADLEQIRLGIQFWNGEVARLKAGGGRRGPRIYGARVGG